MWKSLVVPGTEGALAPFWSPDGSWIAFFVDDKIEEGEDLGRTGGDGLRRG